MPYTPLVLDPTVPESIQAFVAERVEPVLRQVRALLALPVTENFIAALESPAGGVAGAGATLCFAVEGLRLELDAFYCGVRRVTRRLAEDVTLQPGAVRVLQPWFTELQHWENETASRLLSANTVRSTVGGPTPVRTGAARA